MRTNNFFVFEGPNGSGKSTIMKNVAKKLKKKYPDKEIICTREPGATKLGEKIRQLILKEDVEISNLSNLLLFMADRADHYQFLEKYLNKEDIIILCDRFWESTLVYQTIDIKESKEKKKILKNIKLLHRITTNNLKPTATFIITSDYPHGFNDQDKFDTKSKSFRERANICYKTLSSCKMIDYPIELLDTTNKNWKHVESNIVKIINNLGGIGIG